MQPLPGQPKPAGENRVSAVRKITNAGMPQGRHVHADLVGPARLKAHRQQGRGPEGLVGVVVGDAWLPIRNHSEKARLARMTVNRCVHRATGRIRMSLHQSTIDLLHLPLPEGALQHGVGVLTFRDNHDSRGADVQAVDDALTFGSTAGRNAVASGGEAADHGRPAEAGSRMGGHAHRLAHHDDVTIIMDHLEAGHRGRLQLDRSRRRRQFDVKPRAAGHPIGPAPHRPVDAGVAGINKRGRGRPG